MEADLVFKRVDAILDFVGVGFGPSNLALAVAAREIDPAKRGLFFERRPAMDWHPGLLFDSSRMQISFLKDLATLRNPASPYSFLQYVKAKGRLEHFVNVSDFHPTRWEYRDYLRWVAEHFADRVQYGTVVRKVSPVSRGGDEPCALFRVEVENLGTGERVSYRTRNVIYAAGGKPRLPEIKGGEHESIIHSSEFLHRFPQRFPTKGSAHRFGVAGDGQSAGEIVLQLLNQYPHAQVHLFISGYAMRPVDRSPFVNEAFFYSEMEAFHGASAEKREWLSRELRSTNYGVVSPELIDQIYNTKYLDAMKGVQRLFIHPFCTLSTIESDANGITATKTDRCTGETSAIPLDGLVLATGFERKLDAEIFADVLPFVAQEPCGTLKLMKSCRVETQSRISAGLYVQGYGEGSHGLGDTLLSLLPFRSRDIFNDLCRETTMPGLPTQRLRDGEYPPKRHLETDADKLYAVLDKCKFATLISARNDEPVVTHVPLILDRTQGARGILFGHMDRANPHIELLEGREVLAVFHGPNSYISPHVYTTEQLPTWNSISVHVRGRIRLLTTREELLRGLASISETDTRPGAYRLDIDAPVIDRLTNYIVGFELEIEEMTGRFKLSQDRNTTDQRLAAIELARKSEAGERDLIEAAMGYALDEPVETAMSYALKPGSLHEPIEPAVGDALKPGSRRELIETGMDDTLERGSLREPIETATSYALEPRSAREPRVVHELFEEQVARNPDAIAIVFDEQQISYAQLNERANQLAHYLRALGAGPDVTVGLCMERSTQALVALLGIFKAGAAYVPLDPEFPRRRMEHLLRDTAPPLLVTESRFETCIPEGLTRVIRIDCDWPTIAEWPTINIDSGVDPRNLAYCMFTSGSTGKPKAVAVSHEGLTNHSRHMQGALQLTASDRMLQILPLNGDGSLEEILVPLITGAALFPLADKLPSASEFLSFLSRHRISVINLTTAYWHFWVGELAGRPSDEWPQTLRLVMMGGEAVNPEKYRQWRQLAWTRNVTWMQEYGPTEATISCTVYRAPPEGGPEHLSIGHPIANMQIHIVDEQLKPVAHGETGELCIAGVGLARGYLRQPALTAEKFIPNPFGAPGSRLYKTGDFARIRPDGSIQFLGRRDEQVKIQGHRIELGEVESALLQYSGVREAVVVARSSTEGMRLAAFVVADEFAESDARKYLAEILPRQMMPASIIPLATLPVNANGKVDRANLSQWSVSEVALPLENASELECAIARLWTESTGRAPQSVDEDFFLVGGDSLRALSLLGKIAALTGIEVNVAAFFQERTIRMLAAALSAQANEQVCFVDSLRAGSQRAVTKLRREESQRRPASNAQQRLWFLDRLQQAAAYSVPLAYRVTGSFSIERLDECLTQIVARHEALRTALVADDHSKLWQEIAAPMTLQSRRLRANSFAEAMALANAEASEPFDLTSPPLLRSACIHISDRETLLFINFHHSMWDAWSLAVFWRELMMLYTGTEMPPDLSFQYADYGHWQREWLSSPDAEAHRAFWRRELAGDLPLLQLGRLAVPEPLRSTRGAMELCSFNSAISHATRAAAERHGTTEFVIALSAFLATLHRLTRQDQIVLGIPVACRSLPETENIVGFLANTLPLRIVFQPGMRFCDLIEQTRQRLTAILARQELPFDEIVNALESAREGSRNPIFQAMFVMQTTPLDGVQRLGAADVEEVIVHSGTSKVDVTCSIRSGADELKGELEYSTDLMDPTEAKHFIQAFLSALSSATQDSSTLLEELPLLSSDARQEIVRKANSHFERYPDFRPVHAHFEAQSLKTPEAIAIQTSESVMSYQMLNTRANQLARRLMSAGVKPETLIGICMDRSIDMVVALLATLKAGAGFVPLDPHFPIDRIRTIATDARLHIIVTQEPHDQALKGFCTPLVIQDTELALENESNPDVMISAENIAYVYYTSGSTGAPKGVILEHRGAMNRLEWLRRRYPLQVGDQVLLKTPLIFDLSIWEMFGPLMAGATILMADARAESDVTHIGALLSTPGTVFAYFVPSMLDAYLSYAEPKSYPSLKWLCVTGEAMPARLLEQFNRHFQAEFHSTYGQTETSEVALWTGSQWTESATVPVGRPNGIYRLFILDANLNPVPPYVPGEICVAGIGGLARGYQNRPGLTAERFVPNPYAVESGERLYRTGDLGRLLEDGQIEYVGRIDTQVKIRGCRVETAEIEAVLSKHPSVSLCAVIARADASGGAELLAYVVSDQPSAKDLAAHAESMLPQYMLPAAYLFVDELPLTPSGKLDRSRLPSPTQADFAARARYEAPQSELESKLAALWQQVLGLEKIGRTDNFFSLGGNSLKSVQVLVRLKDTFGVNVQVRDFFNSPTIEGLAALVEQALLAYVTSLSASEIDERLALPNR